MQRKILIVVVFVILLLCLNGTMAQSDEFSRRAMLENIGYEIILPLHERFLEQTNTLDAAVDTFLAAPTAESLDAAQEAWREVSRTWHQVSLFRLGRLTFVYHSRIANDGPIARQIIDQFINGTDALDAAALSAFGSNVVGLRTVEYLLFDAVGGNDAVLEKYTNDPTAQRRIQYLLLTVEDFHNAVTEIHALWSPEGADYIADFVTADDPASVLESISMLVNRMIEAHEQIINERIGWPLGTLTGRPTPETVESRYANYDLPQIRSYFEMLRDTFNGQHGAQNGLGFDDYLDFLGARYNEMSLAEAINQQIDAILAALDVIESPLAVTLLEQPDQIQRLYDEGRRLVVLLKTDMASQLGISITFNSNDGD